MINTSRIFSAKNFKIKFLEENKMEVKKENNLIRIYNEGVLIIEETSYTNVVLTINKLKNIIQDVYQLNILNQILIMIELSEVA